MNHRKKTLTISGLIQAIAYIMVAPPLVLLGANESNPLFFVLALIVGYYLRGWLALVFMGRRKGGKMNHNDTRNYIPPWLVIAGLVFWVGFIIFLVIGV